MLFRNNIYSTILTEAENDLAYMLARSTSFKVVIRKPYIHNYMSLGSIRNILLDQLRLLSIYGCTLHTFFEFFHNIHLILF